MMHAYRHKVPAGMYVAIVASMNEASVFCNDTQTNKHVCLGLGLSFGKSLSYYEKGG